MKVYVPQTGTILRVEEPWRISVDWDKYNLRWLAAFGWTGMKDIQKYKSKWNSETKAYQREEYTSKKTVANPLFKTMDGEWKPALCVVPAGTVLQVTRYDASYGRINGVHIKCLECADRKKLKGKVLDIDIKQFSTLEAFEMPEEENEE